MKSLILLSIVLPFCLAIEVKLQYTLGNTIKKVEIPSCKIEPCALVKGIPLNISVTVETKWPNMTIVDLESIVSLGPYRKQFSYPLAQSQSLCKQHPNECPIKLNTVYKIERQLFLSEDNESTKNSIYGSKNGIHYPHINVLINTKEDSGKLVYHLHGLAQIQLNITSK